MGIINSRCSFLLKNLAVLFLAFCLFPQTVHARDVYKSGRYLVRKMQSTCKLEIALYESDLVDRGGSKKRGRLGLLNEPIASLGLFPTDDYFGELFTLRERIGRAKKGLEIRFDGRKAQDAFMSGEKAESDKYWRWVYFIYQNSFLNKIKRKRKMTIRFSNGKDWFRFQVSLKGSSKAVNKMKKCDR